MSSYSEINPHTVAQGANEVIISGSVEFDKSQVTLAELQKFIWDSKDAWWEKVEVDILPFLEKEGHVPGEIDDFEQHIVPSGKTFTIIIDIYTSFMDMDEASDVVWALTQGGAPESSFRKGRLF